jgi:hypothetical protein
MANRTHELTDAQYRAREEADPSCSYLLGTIDPSDGERTFEPILSLSERNRLHRVREYLG